MKIWHLMGYVIAAAVLGGGLGNLTWTSWNNNSRLESLPPPVAVVDVFTAARNCTVLVNTDSGSGSGVLVTRTDTHGGIRIFVWTAYHVVDGASSIDVEQDVYLEGYPVARYSAPAAILAFSAEEDLAFLLVDYPVSPWNGFVTFQTAHPPGIGDPLFHVGNMRGVTYTDSMTTGILARLNIHPSALEWPWEHPLDQSSLIVYPGSSGGGIFDTTGQCVGLIVGYGGPGLSFFVPVRRMYAWARDVGIVWAVVGNHCPDI